MCGVGVCRSADGGAGRHHHRHRSLDRRRVVSRRSCDHGVHHGCDRVNQTVNTAVGAWSLTDAIGNGAAYHVSVTAGAPSIGGTSIAGSLGSTWLALTPTTAAADANNPAAPSTHPVAIAGPVAVGATAVTIENAAVNTGAGRWDFAADTAPAQSLAVTIPANATPGAYSDTLTYTIAAGVGA